MSKQDRIAPRTPADLERRYNFDKSFAEVMGIATDARNEAQEAKKVASSIAETDEGLKIKVKALDDEMVTVKAELDMSVKTDGNGNLTSEMHIGTNKLTIVTDNFNLSGSGEMTANKGNIAGWTIDEFGIHQTHGLYGSYTITYSSTGTSIENDTYEGYLFYCLEAGGIYCYILQNDAFVLYGSLLGEVIPVWLWKGDMFGNHKITRTVIPETPMPI
jgi:hypothetical protein